MLLVHYNDLKSDLAGEIQRVADFLDISSRPNLWPQLVQAATFESMRQDGDTLMGATAPLFKEGSRGFFFKGTNGRWQDVVREEDLTLYDAKLRAILPPACVQWVSQGRLKAGDPRLL